MLLPAVAAFGLATNAALVAAVLGGLNVGLAYRMVWRLTTAPLVAILATLFYGFGTVAWYAAMLGSTWFLAHVVASTFLLLAITTALDADRRTRGPGRHPQRSSTVDRSLAGLLLGLAATARLTTILAAPFFALVGGGGSVVRRALSAGIGAAIPVLLLLAYNVATSGQLFHPGYEHLYQTEFTPVPDGLLAQLFPALQGITYHPGEWALQDPRYIPQNLLIMLGLAARGPTGMRPGAARPGMSAAPTRQAGHEPAADQPRLAAGGPGRDHASGGGGSSSARSLPSCAVSVVNLMHFSQGWVQFGYRFSNDVAPFGLLLVTLGLARYGVRWWTVGLVAVSIVINAWGVYWGVVLGW